MDSLIKIIEKSNIKNGFNQEDYYKDIKEVIIKAGLEKGFTEENYYGDVKKVVVKSGLVNAFIEENYCRDIKDIIIKARLEKGFNQEKYYRDIKKIIYEKLELNYKKPFLVIDDACYNDDLSDEEELVKDLHKNLKYIKNINKNINQNYNTLKKILKEMEKLKMHTNDMEKELEILVEKLQNMQPKKLALDSEELEKLSFKAEKLKALFSYLVSIETSDAKVSKYKKIIQDIEKFINRCNENEFHIAFVGTIKAGKSTLINAILGEDLSSTSVTPETAVLIKFRYGEEAKFKVSFYNNDEWQHLWKSATKDNGLFVKEFNKLNGESEKSNWVGKESIEEVVTQQTMKQEIEKYISSKKVEHYFVKELEVYLPSFPYAKNVVFIDTPGLDDAVDYRSNITREYIKRANVILTCVKADTLTAPELITISKIFDNAGYKPEKVYVLGTQYDTLNNPVEDWKKQKEEWKKYLTNGEGRYDETLAEKNIIPVSGYISNLCRQRKNMIIEPGNPEYKNLQGFNFKFLDNLEVDENLKKLDEFSNVEYLKNKVNNENIVNVNEEIIRDSEAMYKNIVKEITIAIEEENKDLNEMLNTFGENLEEISKKYEEQKAKMEEIKKQEEELNESLSIIEQETRGFINEISKVLTR